MQTKEIIKSQYYASLEMLKQAIDQCPDDLWASSEYNNPFWHTVFHVLFYTHLYLHRREEDFVPWEKHRKEITSLAKKEAEDLTPFGKDEMLAYQVFCEQQVIEKVNALDLEADSGFHWLPFNKLELQFYNIRHIMQHTGELYERLGTIEGIEINWVGMKRAD
jgi:hypothetical protein